RGDGAALTAVELQLRHLEVAQRFAAAGGFDGIVPRADEILALWEDTLRKLRAGDTPALAGRLDWVLKRQILEQALAAHPHLDWESPEIKYLDHAYSSLDPARGLYSAHERLGTVQQLVPAARVAHRKLRRGAAGRHARLDARHAAAPRRAGRGAGHGLGFPSHRRRRRLSGPRITHAAPRRPLRPAARDRRSGARLGNVARRAARRDRRLASNAPRAHPGLPGRTHLTATHRRRIPMSLMYRDDPGDARSVFIPPDHHTPSSLEVEAAQLLERGADAIARALSHDSARFLASNVQEGGE